MHFMITSRNLFREQLSEAFQNDELAKDERLKVIRDELLARMIVEDRSKRIQSATGVLDITAEMLNKFRR